MINVPITFDEAYEFIKLYDTLRDMDFELTDKQQNVFEKIQAGNHLVKTHPSSPFYKVAHIDNKTD
tara:strand:+ start:123 stop:320 length:198 start_codon:yes stop_codon:yes gene_type:complete